MATKDEFFKEILQRELNGGAEFRSKVVVANGGPHWILQSRSALDGKPQWRTVAAFSETGPVLLGLTARYTTVTAGSYSNAAAGNPIDFNVQDFDSDGAVSTGSDWKLIIPAGKGGTYNVSAAIAVGSHTMAAADFHQLLLYKNGTLAGRLSEFFVGAAWTALVSLSGSTLVEVDDGDELQIRYLHNIATNRTLHTSTHYNHVSIHRVPSEVDYALLGLEPQ